MKSYVLMVLLGLFLSFPAFAINEQLDTSNAETEWQDLPKGCGNLSLCGTDCDLNGFDGGTVTVQKKLRKLDEEGVPYPLGVTGAIDLSGAVNQPICCGSKSCEVRAILEDGSDPEIYVEIDAE